MTRSLLTLLFVMAAVLGSRAGFSPYNLKCEHEKNPTGIDCPHPRFSWMMHSDSRNAGQKAYRIVVSADPEGRATVWDSGKVRSDQSLLIPYRGKTLEPLTDYYWKVRIWNEQGKDSGWSTPASFRTGLGEKGDWNGAEWIACQPDGDKIIPLLPHIDEATRKKTADSRSYIQPLFRKEFTASKKIVRATAAVCGLGQFELYINGEKVGNHFLDPGWTKFDKEARYVCFDVTTSLAKGKNTIGVMLGNGFYNVPDERYYKIAGSYGAPKMILCMRMDYDDGTWENIVSDGSWLTSGSPITYSSIYGGEDYDARLEQTGWAGNDGSFDSSAWKKALVVPQNIRLVSQTGTHIVEKSRLPVVRRFVNSRGNWVLDLGQNFSGVIDVAVSGKRGDTVRFHPGELLDDKQCVNQSASGGPYYFSYTLSGSGHERWQPRFTYYGFRYIELEGAVPQGCANPDSLPEIIAVEGVHTACDLPRAGSFECSKPMFNRIYELIDWAVRSNTASVLTDCPHREKLGWLEQAHLMQYSIQYRYHTPLLYTKMMADMAASQTETGVIPTIAPELVRFEGGFEDTPEWGSAFVISPWYIYKWYGDKSLIERYYDAMKRYVDYLGTRAEGNIIAYGLGDWYDIGPNPPGYAQLTTNGVTATAVYYYDLVLMKEMAALLGHTADESHFEALARDVRKAYNERFFNPSTSDYDRGSQTANAISLYMGLVDEENVDAVSKRLIDDIAGRGYALTAGDVGYRYVLMALRNAGASDVIYRMNSKYDVPGYGWQLAHGATTLTESWQAYGFVSNNHFMLGHLMEWLSGGLAGLGQDEGSVAFKRLYIDPEVTGDITSAKISYESPYGQVECAWELSDGIYSLKVDVPANSSAIVCLPTTDVSRISEYGVAIDARKEIRHLDDLGSKSRWLVGSGSYLFSVKAD